MEHTSLKNANFEVLSEVEASCNHIRYKKEINISCASEIICKKTLLLWHGQRLVGVLVPASDKRDYCEIHYWYDNPSAEDPNKYGKRLDYLKVETGLNAESVNETVIDYVVKKFSANMKPFDLFEQKPDGISDQSWR